MRDNWRITFNYAVRHSDEGNVTDRVSICDLQLERNENIPVPKTDEKWIV